MALHQVVQKSSIMAAPIAGSNTIKKMTMRKYIYMAVAAIAALSSCDKTNSIIDGGQEKTVNAPVFTATIEPTTKTTLGLNSETGNYTKINWDINDEVKIDFCTSNKSDYIQAIYQATPGADATTATLSLKAGEVLDPQCDRICQAIYPASMNQYYDIIFPATQYYEGDGKLTNAPMLYYNSNLSVIPTTLTFKNAAAVLAITVPYSQMTSVKSITVSSDLIMNGRAEFDPTTGILHYMKGKAVDAFNSKITLDCYTKAGANVQIPEGGSKTFYISILPLSNKIDGYSWMLQSPYYNYLKIDVTDGTTTRTMRTKDGVNITIDRNTIYPFTFNGKLVPAADPNLLTGEFSVSATKKVKFTKGNLWCNTTTSPVTYAFETNQYDYPTNYTSDGSDNGWIGTHVGHFYWKTTAEGSYAKYSTGSGDSGGSDNFWLKGDVAERTLTVAGTDNLYVLSNDEWKYLKQSRTNAANLYKCGVTVAGKTNCLIIAPDNYLGSIANSYDAAAWATAEATGLLCLPDAGSRSTVTIIAGGYYWTTTPRNNAWDAYGIGISAYSISEILDRYMGCPLRLVKTVE